MDKSPILRPYPNWEFHTTPTNPDCGKIMSVTRIYVDECNRLWVMDSGVLSLDTAACPPKILVFDLITDNLLLSYTIPDDQTKDSCFLVNIIVDVRNGKCNEAYAYVAEPNRFGLLVFSLEKMRSWLVVHHFMYPNPYACEHNFHNEIFFRWADGIFGTALGLPDSRGDRLLYFHPMSSFDVSSLTISFESSEI